MRAAAPPPERWLPAAAAIVLAVTAVRLVLLAFNRTDLFVDEAQYWLWGQEPAWGYYSKPPLVGWVIRAATDLAGSDAAFWIRAPFPVLNGVTALVLGAVAARLGGVRAAVWTAAGFATLPAVAVGSLLAGTDAVMAPFLAGAILMWLRLLERPTALQAAGCGLLLGLAMLGKYAGIYGLLGMALAGLAVRGGWPGWRPAAITVAAALAVLAPNLAWNLSHGMVTFSHTADNIGWAAPGAEGPGFSPAALGLFLASQAAVAGPVVAAALVAALLRLQGTAPRVLAVLTLLPLAAVSVQALLREANANWAFAGWLPGTVLAFVWLSARPRLAAAAVAVNAALCLALPLLTLAPELRVAGLQPLARYTGRAALSEAALAAARETGAVAIVSDRRDVLADLFHTGRDAGIPVHALPPRDRPRHYYEQRHALPPGLAGPVLVVARGAPACPVTGAPIPLPSGSGAYAGQRLAAYPIEAECLHARP